MKKELEELLSHKRNFNLQLFAGDGEEESDNDNSEEEPGNEEKNDKKYTDEDVNNIINRKFAEWEKRQKEKSAKAAEAERLKNMTEEENMKWKNSKRKLPVMKKKKLLEQ